jgi:hypothetical protein
LIKKDVTAFWIAPTAGGGIAFALCLLLSAGRMPGIVLVIAPLCGAAVGAIFWLIARPDRQTAPASPTQDEPVSP